MSRNGLFSEETRHCVCDAPIHFSKHITHTKMVDVSLWNQPRPSITLPEPLVRGVEVSVCIEGSVPDNRVCRFVHHGLLVHICNMRPQSADESFVFLHSRIKCRHGLLGILHHFPKLCLISSIRE